MDKNKTVKFHGDMSEKTSLNGSERFLISTDKDGGSAENISASNLKEYIVEGLVEDVEGKSLIDNNLIEKIEELYTNDEVDEKITDTLKDYVTTESLDNYITKDEIEDLIPDVPEVEGLDEIKSKVGIIEEGTGKNILNPDRIHIGKFGIGGDINDNPNYISAIVVLPKKNTFYTVSGINTYDLGVWYTNSPDIDIDDINTLSPIYYKGSLTTSYDELKTVTTIYTREDNQICLITLTDSGDVNVLDTAMVIEGRTSIKPTFEDYYSKLGIRYDKIFNQPEPVNNFIYVSRDWDGGRQNVGVFTVYVPVSGNLYAGFNIENLTNNDIGQNIHTLGTAFMYRLHNGRMIKDNQKLLGDFDNDLYLKNVETGTKSGGINGYESTSNMFMRLDGWNFKDLGSDINDILEPYTKGRELIFNETSYINDPENNGATLGQRTKIYTFNSEGLKIENIIQFFKNGDMKVGIPMSIHADSLSEWYKTTSGTLYYDGYEQSYSFYGATDHIGDLHTYNKDTGVSTSLRSKITNVVLDKNSEIGTFFTKMNQTVETNEFGLTYHNESDAFVSKFNDYLSSELTIKVSKKII